MGRFSCGTSPESGESHAEDERDESSAKSRFSTGALAGELTGRTHRPKSAWGDTDRILR